MAIGIACMVGIRLPTNFNSPYKAASIIDFWRRWHMTLSRFLKDYLYIPLGGNRKGPVRRYGNLMLTMVLGGLWHGAGWTFVIWGALHGAYLIVNHLWHALRRLLGFGVSQGGLLGRVAGTVLTFLAVLVAWVFFRAESVEGAMNILIGMSGQYGFNITPAYAKLIASHTIVPSLVDVGVVLSPGLTLMAYLGTLLALVWFAPNSLQIMARFSPAVDTPPAPGRGFIAWQPSLGYALGCALLLVVAVLSLSTETVSDFLYFQF
jgi:hypothetical protein